MPERTERLATIIATAAQNLLIVRQKFQHTILQSTFKIVIGWGCHHIRQYTTQDIIINPLKIGKSQLTFWRLSITSLNIFLLWVKEYHSIIFLWTIQKFLSKRRLCVIHQHGRKREYTFQCFDIQVVVMVFIWKKIQFIIIFTHVTNY